MLAILLVAVKRAPSLSKKAEGLESKPTWHPVVALVGCTSFHSESQMV